MSETIFNFDMELTANQLVTVREISVFITPDAGKTQGFVERLEKAIVLKSGDDLFIKVNVGKGRATSSSPCTGA